MYEKIVEWLYLNDGKFGSARQWREEFLKYLKSVLKEEYSITSTTKFNVSDFINTQKGKGYFSKDLTDSTLGQGLKDLLDKKTAEDLGTLWRAPGKTFNLLRLVAINKNGNKYQDVLTGQYVRLLKDLDEKLIKVDEFNF